VEDEAVNPLLHDILHLRFDQCAELLRFSALEWWPPLLRHEINRDHATLYNAQLRATFPPLVFAVHMHRLVLIAVEEHIQTEVFIKFRHTFRIMSARSEREQGRLDQTALMLWPLRRKRGKNS
jgi:hypothetical protein